MCFLRRKLVETLFALSNIRTTCPKTHFSKPTCTVTVTHTQSRLRLFLPTLNRGDLKTCRHNPRKTNRRAQRWIPSCPSVWIWRGSSTCQDVQTERLNSPSEVIYNNMLLSLSSQCCEDRASEGLLTNISWRFHLWISSLRLFWCGRQSDWSSFNTFYTLLDSCLWSLL